MTTNPNTISPKNDDRDPVSRIHSTESPPYPTNSGRPHLPRMSARHRAGTNGSTKTTLAPKLFGSPRVVSTPIMRAMPMRNVCRPPRYSLKECARYAPITATNPMTTCFSAFSS